MKNIYLVRHAKAAGQEPDAPLTEQGLNDADRLIEFFKDKDIEFIISSPFIRAIDTIRPFAREIGKEVNIDDRLQERVLSVTDLADWADKLAQTYEDMDLKFEGGESSREAMKRGVELVKEIYQRPENNSLVVTHGALLSLIIKYYDEGFGYNEWKRLTNPDVYHLEMNEELVKITHLWK